MLKLVSFHGHSLTCIPKVEVNITPKVDAKFQRYSQRDLEFARFKKKHTTHKKCNKQKKAPKPRYVNPEYRDVESKIKRMVQADRHR